MTSLLSLPRELVDNIIEIVLLSSRPPPEDPDAARAQGQRFPVKDFECRSWHHEDVLYGTSPHEMSSESLPLLLVNQQIHRQTKKAIDRIVKAKRLDYHLDVMFVDGYQLWPTFLCVPALTTRVNSIHTDIRIFVMPRDKSQEAYFALRGGSGGPPGIVWAFYALLERFLQRGASYASPGADLDEENRNRLKKKHLVNKDVTIDTLTINFSTPEDPSCVKSVPELYRHPSLAGTGEGTAVSPKYLANFVAGFVRSLLVMGYHSAQFGAILHERIGRIVILVDGKLEREFNLGAELQALNYTDPISTFGHITPRERRPEVFGNWKLAALYKRKQYGFDSLNTIPSLNR